MPTPVDRRPSGWPRYRPPDRRPTYDDRRLAAHGIHRFESKRLKLYTDIDSRIARTLPSVIDQAYDAWEAYFGRLPPNRKGTAYQITGYVMADKKRFRRAGLLPADLPPFLNGRHRGAQFWINGQSSDYYRRHLLIHEGTHCFMTTGPYVVAPLWYMEGMAELFGTHRIDADGRITFRVMPRDPAKFLNFGRIEMIQQDIRKGWMLSLDALGHIDPDEFLKNYPYAWSWALCKLLDTHPRYRKRFRRLGHDPARRRFQPEFVKLFADDLCDLNTEWELFAAGLVYGHDIERAAINFQPGRPIAASSEPSRLMLKTDRGWQSSRVLIEKGRTYRITATGRFHLAEKPKPWISEPQGISFLYFAGRPLGMLLAAVRSRPQTDSRDAAESMLSVIPIGRGKQFVAKQTGTLYFRINDFWADLQDNSGSLRIEIRTVPGR